MPDVLNQTVATTASVAGRWTGRRLRLDAAGNWVFVDPQEPSQPTISAPCAEPLAGPVIRRG